MNDDQPQIPDYLNTDFYLNVLIRAFQGHRIMIKQVKAELGSKPGDNYTSTIYRAKIEFKKDGKDDEVSMVVKTLPLAEKLSILRDLNAYVNEKLMCMDVIPKLEAIIGGAKLGPRCYYGTMSPIQTLVFEDLKVSGFTNANRLLGLDEKHSMLVMRKLGQFHAASLILHRENTQLIEQFRTGLFCEASLDNMTIIPRNVKHLAMEIGKWPGFESISRKICKFHVNFKRVVGKLVEPRENEFRVLNHGDLWVNNFMFKYSDDQPEDVIFVDHQLAFFSSPGIDINYFLNTSPSLDVMQEKRAELIQAYYESLTSVLKDHNYEDIPSFSVIEDEIRNKEFYGFIAAVGLFPIIALDAEHCESDILKVRDKSEDMYHVMFETKRFRDTMEFVLKRFDELKVFEFK